MILAGDIGGTKAVLLLAQSRRGNLAPVFERRYAVAAFPGFTAMLAQFLDDYRQQPGRKARVASACFGAAGPVSGDSIRMTNLPWCLDGRELAAQFGIGRVRLVNDFEAAASGIEALDPGDSVMLQQGEPLPSGARVVIGAGTGLGVAYVLPQGRRYQVMAGEGGHAGFAPADEEQMRLCSALREQFGRVCVEHVVSGPGLERIYQFLCAGTLADLPAKQEGRHAATAAEISRDALERNETLACRALDLFFACYGAVAGDHALTAMARGGVYIAGGIAAKLLGRLSASGFIAAFNAKGVHAPMNLMMPVSVVTTERLGLLGAALLAARA
jgi:glucokinase